MILQIVTHPVTTRMSREEYLADARTTLETWKNEPDLVSKLYCEGPDGSLVGVYLWKSRERAEATHDHHWMQTVLARRGVLPLVEYKDVRMILDNEMGTVTEF
jgi:hypothetical protein